MEYYRYMNGLNEVACLEKTDFMAAVELCVKRLEFACYNMPQNIEFGIYLDKCKQYLPTLDLIEQTNPSSDVQLKAHDLKTRIQYICTSKQIPLFYL